MDIDLKGDYGLKIDFERGTPDPSRVFRSMTGLIDAFQLFDQHLARSINARLEPVLILQDIEAGSLVSWLRQTLKDVDDEALKKVDVKAIVGPFLVKGKYALIEWLEGKKRISSRGEVQELEDRLHQIAKDTDVNRIPAYAPPPALDILGDVVAVRQSLDPLALNDKTLFLGPSGTRPIGRTFEIDGDAIREILTVHTVPSEHEMILQVKKPDYLGESRWLFRHGTHPIEAKILDLEWLRAFQAQGRRVLPGDAIRAIVRTEIWYGRDGEVVHEHYEVKNVLDVVKAPHIIQGDLLTDDGKKDGEKGDF